MEYKNSYQINNNSNNIAECQKKHREAVCVDINDHCKDNNSDKLNKTENISKKDTNINHDKESSISPGTKDRKKVTSPTNITGFNYLKCFSSNVDGLISKFSDIKKRILDNDPDIVALVETATQLNQYGDRYCPDDFLQIEGFQMFRQDNEKEIKGGILIYVKDHLKVSENRILNNLSAGFKESKWIELDIL